MKTDCPGVKKKRLSVHPLFFLAGIVSAFTGSLLWFLSACIAAIEHECAHAFAARRFGFSLDKIVLMPYGAVISGDISGLTPKQEAIVCLAGPLANLATGLLFVALWWLFPEIYPYTEAAASVSFSLFLVNLLPAHPLDGGRLLCIALRPLGKKKARIVRTVITLLTAAGILGYFVYTCFSEPNFTAFAFGIMLAAGAFGGGGYSRIRFSRRKSFLRGVEEKRIAVSADRSLRELFRFLREDRYVVFVLYENEEFLGEVSETEYLSSLERGEDGAPIRNCLPEFIKGA